MPPPASFARDLNFWKAFFLLGVIGGVLGLLTLGFMNFTDKIPKLWVNGGTDVDFIVWIILRIEFFLSAILAVVLNLHSFQNLIYFLLLEFVIDLDS